MFFSAVVNRALEIAAVAHEGHYRKNPGEKIPYVSHAVMVGYLLQKAGYDEDVVTAGILHDVLEDTHYPRERLIQEFGDQIVEWVEWVTERDKSLPWERRKENYLRQLMDAPPEAIAVAVADKIHNLQSILAAVKRGEDIWGRFSRDRQTTLTNLEKVLKVAERHRGDPLVSEFHDLVEQIRIS